MKAFELQLVAAWPPDRWCAVTTLAAVSGGPDSVAMLRALAAVRASTGGDASPGRLIVAHFNHHLRADESDLDQRLVELLARQLGCEVLIGHAQPGSPVLPVPTTVPTTQRPSDSEANDDMTPRSTSEATARAQRYEFLIEAAQRCGARYVAVAHTADDQAETILHHVLRGTGLAGLAGMPAARELTPGVALVRPLLRFRRTEVMAYLNEIEQTFCHDASNLDPAFTRNRIRHELLPQLAQQFNPQVVEALVKLGRLAGDAQQVIDTQARHLAQRSLRPGIAGDVVVLTGELVNVPRFLVREMLIVVWREQGWPLGAMSYDHWEQLAELATTAAHELSVRKRVFPGHVIAERVGERFILTRGTPD